MSSCHTEKNPPTVFLSLMVPSTSQSEWRFAIIVRYTRALNGCFSYTRIAKLVFWPEPSLCNVGYYSHRWEYQRLIFGLNSGTVCLSGTWCVLCSKLYCCNKIIIFIQLQINVARLRVVRPLLTHACTQVHRFSQRNPTDAAYLCETDVPKCVWQQRWRF